MRFVITFLILAKIAGYDNDPLSEADVCADTTSVAGYLKDVRVSESGPTGVDDYYYEEWTNSPGGDNKLLVRNESATFRAEWNMPDDFLGRVGARWPERTGKEYTEYGNMVAEYTYTRSGPNTAGERYNFIGVYGWAYDNDAKGIPLVEYYIIDDWFGNDELPETDPIPESTACHDSPAGWVCLKGSFSVDGGLYKIYTNWRVEKPSIVGDTTFIQYFSIRQSYRKCGKITISEHFKKWESLNLRMGNLFEASLLVEVQKGEGWIDYTHARVLTNVSDSDLDSPPVTYAPACVDRTPSAGSCSHSLDQADAPPCHVQPDNTCGPSCPLDYELDNTANKFARCVAKSYTAAQCLDRPVQRSGCKDSGYNDASCDLFGCGPSCYLNARHTNCTLACSAGEAAAGTGKHCELKPCSERVPPTSSSSHSASNAAATYDVVISVKEVLFKFGYKDTATVKITINGVTKESEPLAGNSATFTVNQDFTWTGVAPGNLDNVAVDVQNQYPIGSAVINISDIVYKVSGGVDESLKYYDPDPNARWSNTYTMNYKVTVGVGNPTNWRCGLPTEPSPCYLEGGTCVPACDSANTADDTTGVCVPPSASYLHAARWGGWALCLLIVVILL